MKEAINHVILKSKSVISIARNKVLDFLYASSEPPRAPDRQRIGNQNTRTLCVWPILDLSGALFSFPDSFSLRVGIISLLLPLSKPLALPR